MRHKRLIFNSLFLMLFGISGLQAQESINATGFNASGSGGSVSYSVGQISYETHAGSNGSVSEGVQQPYEISLITSIEETIEISLSVTAYPNPATDFLLLDVENDKWSYLSYQLFDLNGKLLQNEKIEGNQTNIDMSNLLPSTYFLKVNQDNREIKTFKIIKN